ncbi:hypothetical protein CDAR_87451 [Caerostris darwini]|uniref:Uncharacterized protein n=1 Tax=Caerostris darwini TaxID=1538125 RepID=A0AAV4UML8_9ARAC|nr:hypothetical protein CDAR_87451 [Caerostris darwini]
MASILTLIWRSSRVFQICLRSMDPLENRTSFAAEDRRLFETEILNWRDLIGLLEQKNQMVILQWISPTPLGQKSNAQIHHLNPAIKSSIPPPQSSNQTFKSTFPIHQSNLQIYFLNPAIKSSNLPPQPTNLILKSTSSIQQLNPEIHVLIHQTNPQIYIRSSLIKFSNPTPQSTNQILKSPLSPAIKSLNPPFQSTNQILHLSSPIQSSRLSSQSTNQILKSSNKTLKSTSSIQQSNPQTYFLNPPFKFSNHQTNPQIHLFNQSTKSLKSPPQSPNQILKSTTSIQQLKSTS